MIVSIEKTIKKLDEADIPGNLINTLRDFYNKTKLINKGITIHTNKGLFQEADCHQFFLIST